MCKESGILRVAVSTLIYQHVSSEKPTKLWRTSSRANNLHHHICLYLITSFRLVEWRSMFPGSMFVSGSATFVVNSGTTRVLMGVPM